MRKIPPALNKRFPIIGNPKGGWVQEEAFITFAVKGEPARNAEDQTARLALFKRMLKDLPTTAYDIQAIVFPGGFFSIPRANDRQPISVRERLEQSPLLDQIKSVTALYPELKNIPIIIGVDEEPAEGAPVSQKQMVLAWQDNKLMTCTEKALFTQEDIDVGCTQNETAVTSPDRIITLPNGEVAIIGVCYDMFGLGKNTHQGKSAKTKEPLFKKLLKKYKPTVALGALHSMEQPGREVFWQRHGIATASAGLSAQNIDRPSLALGAVHYRENMIDLVETRKAQSLAACDVPKVHLTAGSRRQTHSLTPFCHLLLPDPAYPMPGDSDTFSCTPISVGRLYVRRMKKYDVTR